MSGHDVITVEPRDDLKCPHCRLYLRDAIQTPYGDRLCKACFQKIAKMESQRCPCCGIDASVDEHRKECKGLLEQCSNRGCGLFVTVDKLEQHTECCPYSEATCQYCGRKLQLNELGPHYDECERFLVSCPSCEARVAREELTDHMTTKCSGSKPESPATATFCIDPQQESQKNQKDQPYSELSCCKEVSIVPVAKLEQLQAELAEVKAQNFELKTQNFEIGQLFRTVGNGTLMWKITEVSFRRKALLEKTVLHIDSPPFYTSVDGYKLCIRLHLTGEMRHDGYMSVSIVILEGEYDAVLKWPFEAKVCMQLLSLSSSTRPHLEDSCNVHFQQPQMFHSFPQFAKLSDASAHYMNHYVKDDTMFLKCTVSVDTS